MDRMEVNKYLTKQLGLCWHKGSEYVRTGLEPHELSCSKCNMIYSPSERIDFSTWNSFGQLWSWAIKQEWWDKFVLKHGFTMSAILVHYINPEKFSNTIYNFLKEKHEKE